MLAYPWPGNVRELQNRVKRAVLLAEGPLLEFPDLEANKQPCGETAVSLPAISPLKDEEAEKETIIKALKACDGHREQAARLLKINPSTLYRKMNKYGLK